MKLKLPELVYCEITNNCPLRCVMCPNGNDLITSKGFMDRKIFEKIVDEISLWKPKPSLGLYNMGEFLEHPQCFDFIRYAKSKNLRVFTCSNAFLLDKEKSIALIESGLDEIRFSFEGDDQKLYEKMRERSSYKKVFNNIQNFLRLLAKSNKKMIVDILVIRYSKKQSLEVKEEFKKMFTSIYDVNFYSYYASNWRNTVKKEFLNMETKSIKAMKQACIKFESAFIIIHDGRVLHCDLDYNGIFSIFNVKDITLREIAYSNKRRKILETMKDGRWNEIDSCRGCPVPYTILNRKRCYETKSGRRYLEKPLQHIQHEENQY